MASGGFASAFAGLSQALSSEKVEEIPKTPHSNFINTFLLPNTIKIQKELRGRRFREVQAKLQEAVMALHAFQTEPWPPSAPPSKEPERMKEKKSPEKKGPSLSGFLEQSSDTATVATVETDVESVVGDFTKETQQDDLKPFDEAGVAPGDAESARALEVDDPQTKEFVHEAVVSSLEAYAMCMAHPSRTIKACEYALECVQKLVDKQYVSGRAGGRVETQKLTSEDSPPPLMQQVMEGVAKCSESNAETIEIRVVQVMKSIMTSPRCGIHEASMLLAIRSTFHIYLVTKSPACQYAAKMTLLDMLHSIFARMETMEAMLSSTNNNVASPTSQYHIDSYVLFRSLCKLSSKELPGMDDGSSGASSFLAQQFASAVDPLALNNKVLSLELILALMERAGDAVCHGERFINLVQTQLCVALLKNCMSNHVQVAFLSQKIFLILVYKFKTHLKQEIEVFMSNIFLRVLDSPNSSFKQKALVLESLRSLCNDPVLLTQIFLNYDCDFDAMNLYKDIVFNLTKLSGKSTAMPVGNLSKKEADQHNELSLAGVEVLVAILKAFLKALGLPGGDRDSDDTAGANIRHLLKLDVGDAARPEENISKHGDKSNHNDSLEAGGGGLQETDTSERRRALHHQGSSSDVAGKIVDAFDRKRTAEQNFELGSVKFTLSLKLGLNFFVDNGFVTLDAKEIAVFFIQNKDKLDKTQMGEVLGREPDAPFLKVPKDLDPEKGGRGFFVRILHHYADSMEFTGIMFDDAIRLFLSGFRLPGEAQKIDRIMEKFAQRFTEQNLDVFPSADTAFILAFSVIMLNTDLHNPSIKPERRMTQAGFVRNNKGIGDNGADLPEDFLIGIFERIKAGPFSLKEDDAAREAVAVVESSLFFDTGGSFFRTSAEERRKEKFKKEREDMVAATEQLIRGRSKKVQTSGAATSTSKLTEAVAPADVVKPMFDVTWGPMIGILSQILECSNDERSIAVCLNGFVYAIRLAAHSNMSLARETFVNSLAKFTYLGSIKEMKRKNIESIRTLLSIAVIDGEYLGESWGPVLQCISQLSRMRMSASGLDSDESFLQDESNDEGGKKAPTPRIDVLPDGGGLFRHPTRAEITKETEDNNGRAILAAVNEVLIDKVFSSTVKLSSRSLAHFIEQLVAVSNSEIDGDSKSGITGVAAQSSGKKGTGSAHGDEGPSIFCLQKLVEVADYNMDVRPRLAWTKIWGIMAAYFAKIGCHKNAMVSFFAIDSLKQLSNKFLEKPELSEYNFQRIFLKPFLEIMETPGTREDTRQLILQCVDNTTRTKSHNIQSGWKIFFSILTVSASDPSEKITFYGLNILQRFLDEHLDQICRLSEVEEGGVGHEEENTESLTALERRNRNSNAEDFIEMCRASLSFVQTKESDSPRAVGSSMRAICHTAIFADLLAQHRVKPPVSGAQVTDPDAPGFTYEGLDETEELEMVLWRPIFEGLAEGIRCTAISQAGGVGNMVQRGSILALRAILLRHGSAFTINQLSAVLQQTILPSMQRAVESDHSPVVSITSESPTVSSLDFLTDAMPLPPPPTDPGLMKFQEVALANGFAPKRGLGTAELLVEASFTDMRHGGDGDVGRAYRFANKDMRVDMKGDQPFPDSWIATTAPVALGFLTDISSEIVLAHGAAGRELIWPSIGSMIQRWCNGDTKENGWSPCEAVVRIACREMSRFSVRLADALTLLSPEEAIAWTKYFFNFSTGILFQSLDLESAVQDKLLGAKLKELKLTSPATNGHQNGSSNAASDAKTPLQEEPETKIEAVDRMTWVKLVPSLKIRCVAVHSLQQSLFGSQEGMIPLMSESEISTLMKVLNRSRALSDASVKNGDLAHAFKEAMFDWGMDDEEMAEEAVVNVARLSHTQGSAIFFLTQTAGATNVIIRVLRTLYLSKSESSHGVSWDRGSFAESYLLELMQDVLHKFVESEAKEGHLIDPNVWRNASASGGQVALYCTSFAAVVVDILKAFLNFPPEQCYRYRHTFFPMMCRMIPVHSDEIRLLVQRIMMEKFAPFIGIDEGSNNGTNG